jgi:LuxR family transcriptional regulator, quorum-sensing system regulator SdiA
MTRRASIAALLHDLDARSPAGCAIALHIRFTRPAYLFQTYPQRWRDHYTARGLVMHDPTVRWGLQNSGHVRWADLEAIDAAGVLDEARGFGLMNGVTLAAVTPGSRSIASFARADRDFEDAEIREIEDLLRALHEATLEPGALDAEDRRALTELSIRLTH